MTELTPAQERKLQHAIASIEIDCPPLDQETKDKLRAVAAGEMTADEYVAWVKACAQANGEVRE